MNTKRLFLTCSLAAMLCSSIQSRAEDIDLYSSAASVTGADLPNVLFILANAASFSASAPACIYDSSAGGGSPSLDKTGGGIEQCALVNAINSLPVKADGTAVVNIGIMVFNDHGKDATFGCNASGTGGCLVKPLTAMTAANKTSIIDSIKAWTSSGTGAIKSNNEATAQAMQEAWAYFAGKTGMSGTTYTSPALSGCQKNYVIFIGNADKTPGDASATPGTELATTINNNTALTTDQRTTLNGTIQISSGAYGTSAFTCSPNPYTMGTNHTETSGLYADEWVRYMHDVDLKLGSMPANRKVVTYTIGVLNSGCAADFPALLTSMALRGGGKYFATGNADDITQAILRVLNEVQAVNSVFSSSSLPVSVNTQGTYLNQIFMGMFRPDAQGTPRWLGNLKQYQFSYDATTQNLFLSDALGIDAISGAGTGFLSPNAASFWTCGNSNRGATPNPALVAPYDTLPACNDDPTVGFWANNTNGIALGYDLPDGEVVEKGGAAQMLRLANFHDDYTATPGSSNNPRKLYTYCPGGTCTYPNDCSSAPTDPSCQLSNTANVFDRSNAAITDAMLGTGSRAISSITTAATVTPASTVAVAHAAGTSTTPASITILSFTKSNTTVTATVSAADFGLISPTSRVTVTNVSSKVNCTSCVITSTDSATHTFTYSSGNGNLTSQSFSATISNPYLGSPYSVVTVNTSADHGLSPGQTITFASTTSTTPCTVLTALNNTIQTVTSVTTTSPYSFSITLASSTLSGTDYACKYSPNTATVTTASDHGFPNGAFVTIAGATPASYNGSWQIVVTDATHFTYEYTAAAPLANFSGSGATATSTGTTRDALTRWVRGEDNIGDEASLCPPGTTAGTGNCPATAITIRPSVHGDVLHSRPVVLNYGGTTGVIVFYGGNDGVFRAVNGNQVNPTSSTLPSPGNELWGFIPTEFLGKLKRQHDNSPALLMPSTLPGIIPAPQKKDYFVDGATGVYQVIDGNGKTTKAYLYLAMRRGGRFIYALDVTDPSSPVFLWKHSNTDTGFSELGQTWSQPKVAMVNGYPTPVLIFGAGYDADAEDAEPPTADSMGRGIFILDAVTGSPVWKATYGATTTSSSSADTLPEMKYSIPSDITLVDRNNDGKIDRLYAGDVGGNLWRVDLGVPNVNNAVGAPCATTTPAGCTPDLWHVKKLAALGCGSGPCASGTPRKIFYPPEVLTTNSTYDAVFVATGDREHPLYTTTQIAITSTSDSTNRTATASATDVAKIGAVSATNRVTFANGDTCTVTVDSATTFTYSKSGCGASGSQNVLAISTPSACFVTNRAYLLTDTGTSLNTEAASTALTEADLFNATFTAWNGAPSGYYITFQVCEKSVNAPLVVAGYIYFGTNRAKAPENETCEESLGEATGYRLSPFSGQYTAGEFEGGGLPPSPVSGIVNIVDQSGNTTQVPFCIGCGGEEDDHGDNPCGSDSALAGCRPPIEVTTDRSRTYWYLKNK